MPTTNDAAETPNAAKTPNADTMSDHDAVSAASKVMARALDNTAAYHAGRLFRCPSLAREIVAKIQTVRGEKKKGIAGRPLIDKIPTAFAREMDAKIEKKVLEHLQEFRDRANAE